MKLRQQPYTKRGISRVPCVRCGKPSSEQWNVDICALPISFWVGLCTACDVLMNKAALDFLRYEGREKVIADYRRSKRR